MLYIREYLIIGETDKTLKHLKKVYKNSSIFELSGIKELPGLPRGYLSCLLKRMFKSFAGKNGFSKLRFFEIDLSKLHFRIETSASIHLKPGEILYGNCDLPNGLAGDPNKKFRVIEKFERECIPLYDTESTAILLKQIMDEGFPTLKGQRKTV